MCVIYKYELYPGVRNVLSLPSDRHVVKVDFQRNGLFIWVAADYHLPLESVSFHIVATGQEISTEQMKSFRHVGTAVSDTLVWHVFSEET